MYSPWRCPCKHWLQHNFLQTCTGVACVHYLYIIVHIKPCYVCSLFMVLWHLLGGYLFAWGDNRNGQLGIGNSSLVHNLPEHVSSLVGVPFALLCAGGYHSFALSLSGALFSWGRNKYVCLADSTFVVMVLLPGNAVQVFTQNSFFIVKESF